MTPHKIDNDIASEMGRALYCAHGNFATLHDDIANRPVNDGDNMGCHIGYTLDAMGNRTEEKTKNPTGTLTRQIQRVYDSQNRLQEVIGL